MSRSVYSFVCYSAAHHGLHTAWDEPFPVPCDPRFGLAFLKLCCVDLPASSASVLLIDLLRNTLHLYQVLVLTLCLTGPKRAGVERQLIDMLTKSDLRHHIGGYGR